MDKISLSYVKAGEMFKRKPDAKIVFVRGHYDRATKKYACHDFNDVNREIFLSGSSVVCTSFDF